MNKKQKIFVSIGISIAVIIAIVYFLFMAYAIYELIIW